MFVITSYEGRKTKNENYFNENENDNDNGRRLMADG